MAARKMSKLRLRAMILLAAVLLLLLPSAVVAKAMAIDASKTQRLDLPDGLVGPESVAFDRRGGGPYVSISDARVLKYGGEGGEAGWATFAYSPSYAKCSPRRPAARRCASPTG